MSAQLQTDYRELIARHFITAPSLIADLPASETAAQAVSDLLEDFDLLEDWTERYQYIIDLGRKLPTLPVEYHTPDHLLHGCQSQVWLVTYLQNDLLYINAQSDSAIVSGLIAILQKIYNARAPQEILETNTDFLAQLGLNDHLSPTRRNGLHAMVQAIRTIAAAEAYHD